MAALARLRVLHNFKGRVHTVAVIVHDGHEGSLQGRQFSYMDMRQLHSAKSTYNHLISQSVVLARFKPNNGSGSRNLLTKSSSDNLDEVSKLPLLHPTKGSLVYTGKMAHYVKALKTLSLSTSLLALLAQPMVLSAAKENLMFKAGLMGSMTAVVFLTPLLVHFVTKKYVTDIYYNKDTRMFTLAYRSFFLRRKEFNFKADDVIIPFTPRMFVTHVIKGRSCFVDYEDFRDMEVYKHMVGYDKPMEFTVPRKEDPSKKSVKKKKFGLFEDEKDKIKPVEDEKLPPELFSSQMMIDDDDDEYTRQPVKEKQKNKVR